MIESKLLRDYTETEIKAKQIIDQSIYFVLKKKILIKYLNSRGIDNLIKISVIR